MNLDIDESMIKAYAEERIKTVVVQKVSAIVKEWDFYKQIDNTIQEIIKQRVTQEAVDSALAKLDKDDLIKVMSKRLAEEIADRIYRNGY